MKNNNEEQTRTSSEEMLKAAREYTAAGLIIHPLRKPTFGTEKTGKAPIEDGWQNRETTRSDEDLFKYWGRKAETPYNIGLQCGKRSGITVIDIDDYNPGIINELLEGLNPESLTMSRRTPERGHLYFKYSDRLEAVKKHFIGLEILNNGSNAVLPPSNHYTGAVYKMNREVTTLDDFPEMPEILEERLLKLFKDSDSLEAALNKCRKCIREKFKELHQSRNTAFYHTSTGRDFSLALMIELKANGGDTEVLLLACKLMFRGEYTRSKSEKELSYILNFEEAGGKPWTCETIRSKCGIITIEDGTGKALCDTCKGAGKKKKRSYRRDEEEKTGSKAAILCNDLSDSFIETYPVKTLEDGDLRIYDNGIYQTCKNKYVANNLMIELAGEMGLILTPNQIKDALEMVKSKTPGTEINTPLNLIPVNNGILNIETMELLEYTPENIFLSKFPINYNPKAKQPIKFLGMLETTFKGVEHQIPVIQEMFGYVFLRSYFIEVIFFLIGNGGNGKTLLLNILSALLGGSEHVSYLSFKELSEPKNENMLYDLFGKYANICGDTGKQKIKETDIIKKVTGNDFIRARRLYKDSFNFKNFAKIILAFNRLPEVADFSDGFKRRIKTIEFPNTFDGESANKNLEKEIIEGGELEGVFLWALEGLKRLLKNNVISNTESIAIRGLEYARKSTPMYFFVRECLEHSESGFVRKAELLEAYVKYAKYNRLPQLTAQEFKSELIKECKEIDIDTREKRNQKLSDRPYGFTNIRIDKAALAERTGENLNPSPIEFKEGAQGSFKASVAGTEHDKRFISDVNTFILSFPEAQPEQAGTLERLFYERGYTGYRAKYGAGAVEEQIKRSLEFRK